MAKIRSLMILALASLAACGREHPGSGPSPILPDASTSSGATTAPLTPTPLTNTSAAEQSTVPTEAYGPLVVKEGNFTAESSIRPWSSWWYPMYQTTLFESDSDLAPLQKFDRAASKGFLRRSTHAADWEKTNAYQPRAENWAGLCDAWAIASIMSPEPKALRYKGIDFSVGDLKALLLKTYENIEGLRYFGRRNNARWDDDYADIYPDQFHRFLQAEVFEKKLPFIMDIDASFEVWNTPAWKVQTKITRDPADAKLMHVHTWIWTASPHVEDLNYVGTLEVVHEYTYDLRGSFKNDGSFAVQSGAWTDRSRADHPDYVIAKPDSVQRRSNNPEVDVRMVDDILSGGTNSLLELQFASILR